ncbi:MAG: PD40 domain-containing protein [Verrucomicrobiota bacterium]|nr:PD40 domain-containing protein [Verrucomicrobiota bacterium]
MRIRFFPLLLPLLLCSEERLEIALSTQSQVKSLYIYAMPSESDNWEELRNILAFDIGQGGQIPVAPFSKEQEKNYPPFQKETWNAFRYLLVMQEEEAALRLSLIDVEKEQIKSYAPISLTGDLSLDRRALHLFSDRMHQELFGAQGIASLRILYTEKRKNPGKKGLPWISEVWISDYDGANAKQLTHTGGYCLSPGVFREGEFFYVFHDEGQSKIYRASLARPDEKKMLFAMRGNQALPAIAQTKDRIAFIADLTGRPDLFFHTLDATGNVVGKARQLYSAPRSTQASPTFSPDGKKIAFVSDKDGTPRIYLLELAKLEMEPRLLTKKYRDNSAPCWSPDGTKIAYAAKVDGVRQICLFDCVAETETVLTDGAEVKENPSWAPDSFHLLYNTEDGPSELYLLTLDGSSPVQISRGTGQKRFGAWYF